MREEFHPEEYEQQFSPAKCDLWQSDRIPMSPLIPKVGFLRWFQSDSEDNYRIRGDRSFSPEDFGYEFNDYGYRGPNPSTAPEETRVLFLGDSNTFGLGMPFEDIWPSILVKELEKSWAIPVRQINLAWGGTGSDYCAMMIHQVTSVLKPALVCILWSFASRMTWFPDAHTQQFFLPSYHGKRIKDHEAYVRLMTEAQGFYGYVRNLNFVSDHLALRRIPWLWGNVEEFTPTALRPYVPLDRYVGRWRTIDSARDSVHGGPKSHSAFAELMLNRIERLAR